MVAATDGHGNGTGAQPMQCSTPTLRDTETDLIRHAVDAARGNVAEAARRLGISRATVYRRMKLGRQR